MLPSGLPVTVDDGEPLARFCYQSGHFAKDKPHYTALMPHNGSTSVFRVDGMTAEERESLARQYPRPNSPAKGDALFTAGAGRALERSLDADDTPPRHAHGIGWPEEKNDIMLRATQLAAAATVVRF